MTASMSTAFHHDTIVAILIVHPVIFLLSRKAILAKYMQWPCVCLSVCLSVCPSVERVF